MDNVLMKLNNADDGGSVINVNLAAMVWIRDDGSGNLLVGLSDGTRFHMSQKIKDLPPSLTNLIR